MSFLKVIFVSVTCIALGFQTVISAEPAEIASTISNQSTDTVPIEGEIGSVKSPKQTAEDDLDVLADSRGNPIQQNELSDTESVEFVTTDQNVLNGSRGRLIESDRGIIRHQVRNNRGRGGPQRDDIELEGMMFAVFQDGGAWQWMNDQMMERDPLLTRNGENANYRSYRNAGDWDDVDFEEFNAIVVAAGNQSGNFAQRYNANLERFEEYIAGGGGTYFETGNANCPVRSPGGITNNGGNSSSNGVMVVSIDLEEDNYSLMAQIMHDEQADDGNFWDEGYVIQGNSWNHAYYQMAQFDNGLEDGVFECCLTSELNGPFRSKS